jgi:hypothetical protein
MAHVVLRARSAASVKPRLVAGADFGPMVSVFADNVMPLQLVAMFAGGAAIGVGIGTAVKLGPRLFRYVWAFLTGGGGGSSEDRSDLPGDTLAAYQEVAARESYRDGYEEPPESNPFHGRYF